jgi:hypothetical protein
MNNGEALERYYRAYQSVHSAYDGECEHGFGPPATECPCGISGASASA